MGDVPAVILAGGLGTRLGPAAGSVPKALVRVAGRPFIDHQLELLRRNGVERVVLCLGHLGGQVEAHLRRGAHGLVLEYAHDGDRLLGTGGALRRAAPLLGPLCWVLYGDSYTDIDLAQELEGFDASPALGLMTVFRNEGRFDRSNVLFRDGRLLAYDKRAPTPDMAHIDYGVSLLRGGAVERIPSDCHYDLGDLYRVLVSEGLMFGREVARRFYEIGSPEGLAETSAYLASRSARDPEVPR